MRYLSTTLHLLSSAGGALAFLPKATVPNSALFLGGGIAQQKTFYDQDNSSRRWMATTDTSNDVDNKLVLSQEELQQALPQMFGMGQAYFSGQILYTVTRLGVPDVIGAKTLSVDEIADGLLEENVNKEALERCLRFLAAQGIFKRTGCPTNGHALYSLTPNGALLQTDVPGQPSMACGVLHWMEAPMWQGWLQTYDFVAGKNENPWAAAHDGVPIFDFYAQHPESAKPFNEFMTFISSSAAQVVLDLVPWKELSGKKIVDVGGGYGTNAGKVLEVYPDVNIVSMDLPEVVEMGQASGEAPEGVALHSGDFFDPSSFPENIDGIFMKSILHDWDDEHCIKILTSCFQNLPPGGKIYNVDSVLPDPGQDEEDHIDLARAQYSIDALMMVVGGKERTKQQWRDLAASVGFEIESFTMGTLAPNGQMTTFVKPE